MASSSTNQDVSSIQEFYQAKETRQPIRVLTYFEKWFQYLSQYYPEFQYQILTKSTTPQFIVQTGQISQYDNSSSSSLLFFKNRNVGVIFMIQGAKENLAESFEEQYNKHQRNKIGPLDAIYLICEDVNNIYNGVITSLRRTNTHETWVIAVPFETLIWPIEKVMDYKTIKAKRITSDFLKIILLNQIHDVGGHKFTSSTIPELLPKDYFAVWHMLLPGEIYLIEGQLGYPMADEPIYISDEIDTLGQT